MRLPSLVIALNSNNIILIISVTLIWSFVTSRKLPAITVFLFFYILIFLGSLFEYLIEPNSKFASRWRHKTNNSGYQSRRFPEDRMGLATVSFAGWVSGFIL